MTMETIKIDGELIRVDELSDVMQNMTVLFEHIAENEAGARKTLATFEAARMEITRRMVATYKHEQDMAAEAATTDQANLADSAEVAVTDSAEVAVTDSAEVAETSNDETSKDETTNDTTED